MIGRAEFSGATSAMAHPYSYAFLISWVMCVFGGLVCVVLVGQLFSEREGAVFTVGFLVGGFVFAWLLGSFDTDYGLVSAAGFVLGLLGTGYFLLRNEDGRNG